MKGAIELTSSLFVNSSEHKRRAATMRRLAGGLRSELASAEASGLSELERETLKNALNLLSRMANARSEATAMAKKREDDRARRASMMKKAISDNFGKLNGPMDKICLIVVMRPFGCSRPEDVEHLIDRIKQGDMFYLEFYFKDALEWLIHRLSDQPGAPDELVTAAWEKFLSARGEIEKKYAWVTDGDQQAPQADAMR